MPTKIKTNFKRRDIETMKKYINNRSKSDLIIKHYTKKSLKERSRKNIKIKLYSVLYNRDLQFYIE